MNYWRMTFRCMDESMWHECYQRGVASMSEYNEDGEGVPDLTDVPASEFAAIWNSYSFRNITSRIGIYNLRYKMACGDVIYAKDGPEIVGCGVVTSEYQYDPTVMDGSDAEWEHFVRVDWNHNFRPIKALLGAERQTLLLLKSGQIAELDSLLRRSGQALERPGNAVKPVSPPASRDSAAGIPSPENIMPGS